MKKFLLAVCFILCASFASADCTGTVISISQNDIYGNVDVDVEYTLNGTLVQTGKIRFDEGSGTAEEIKQLLHDGIEDHCRNLILRIKENKDALDAEIIKINKEKSLAVLTALQATEVGYTSNPVNSEIITYKGKQIEAKSDKTFTVSNITP